jgi:hypothetical protein
MVTHVTENFARPHHDRYPGGIHQFFIFEKFEDGTMVRRETYGLRP